MAGTAASKDGVLRWRHETALLRFTLKAVLGGPVARRLSASRAAEDGSASGAAPLVILGMWRGSSSVSSSRLIELRVPARRRDLLSRRADFARLRALRRRKYKGQPPRGSKQDDTARALNAVQSLTTTCPRCRGLVDVCLLRRGKEGDRDCRDTHF